MKALKYTLTLILGLGMLGFSARVQAQASGQTSEVVPAHATPLPEVPAQVQDEQPAQQVEEQPQRGMVTPKAIEELMDNRDFESAIKEFEKYMKTAKGDPCDLIYLPLSFYERLRMEDASKTDLYQSKMDYYTNQFLQTCGNTVDGYLLKESLGERIPDSTVASMTLAIEIEPNYAMLYTMRGDALWQLNRTQEACADFKKAMELKDEYAIHFYKINCALVEAAE
ncbi:MAG: hypothetical protein K2I68_03940 [Bacteroidales bacterium]|nr:hypothetical protein [Bacteroidales bacterium]